MTFRRTETGKKTRRMRQIESHLGRSLEEDYREFYIEQGWGQKRLADRWGVKTDTIFHASPRNRRRSWVEMLGLPVRREEDPVAPPPVRRPVCEACSEDRVPLERAHWLEARNRGPASPDNTLMLCPNCHAKLDRGLDVAFTERLRAIMLHKAASNLLARECSPTELLAACQRILAARRRGAQQVAPADGARAARLHRR